MAAPDRVTSYAQAFYEAAVERWLSALDGASVKLAGDPALVGRLQAADIEFIQRQPLVDRLLPADADLPVRNLLYALAQRGDLGLLPEIVGALRGRATRAAAAPIVAEVTSAVPLVDAERAALIAKLQAQFGGELDVRYQVDPAILGGLVVRVGDKLIDGSVSSKLAAMKQALGVASHE